MSDTSLTDWMLDPAGVRRRGGGGGDRPTLGDYDTPEDEDAPKPIGVPADYTAPRVRTGRYSPQGAETAARMDRLPGTIGQQGPRYFDGDEFTPASLDPASIGEMQRNLARAGLLTNFRYGVWDGNSAEAYRKLLENANAAGQTAEMMLARMVESPEIDLTGGGGGRGGVLPQIATTNKEELRQVFRRAVIDTLGQGWSQEQIDELVNSYNFQEIRVQREAMEREQAAFEASMDPFGPQPEPGVVEDMQSPESFLQSELERRDPVGVQMGRATEEFIPTFMDMLGGWV